MTRPKEKLILIDSVYGAENHVKKLAAATADPVPPETVAEGKSFGEWILMVLLTRPEGEALRKLAGVEILDDINNASDDLSGNPGRGKPWEIYIHDADDLNNLNYNLKGAENDKNDNNDREDKNAPENISAEDAQENAQNSAKENGKDSAQENGKENIKDLDLKLLDWEYIYNRETGIPAKVTATQLKGRVLDEEIAEHTRRIYTRPLEQPKFRWKSRGLTPAERGTATHLVLQYLDFNNLNIAAQIENFVGKRLLTPEQAEAADTRAILKFLKSGLADEIRKAKNIWREYPFMILLDASEYDESLKLELNNKSGDKILLQGVADCCFETDDGLVIVDFKTDHVYGEEIKTRAARYESQLRAYGQALERVLEKPVRRRVLYFLSPGVEMEI